MAIDEQKIVDVVVRMNQQGDEEGIIDAFDVYLTNHYADYYNRISFRFEEEVRRNDAENLEIARALLIMSGHVCAFHTFDGISRSDAWKALIAPMCETPEDRVRGIIAVVNAFGWGVWKAIEISPERLVLRIANSYESTGFLREFGRSDHSECYLATGATAGLMNLFFTPGHDEQGLATGCFRATEIKCRCKGDPYCEFVVTR